MLSNQPVYLKQELFARVTLPMFLLMCVAVAIIYIFPGLVTWLPRHM